MIIIIQQSTKSTEGRGATRFKSVFETDQTPKGGGGSRKPRFGMKIIIVHRLKLTSNN